MWYIEYDFKAHSGLPWSKENLLLFDLDSLDQHDQAIKDGQELLERQKAKGGYKFIDVKLVWREPLPTK